MGAQGHCPNPNPDRNQTLADAARQTVFKYRHDRIQDLQNARAYGQPRAPSPAPTAQWAGPSQTAATPAPVVAASSPPADTATAGGGAVSVDGSVLARLEALEAALQGVGGYDAGFAQGFAQGFAAGHEAN